MGCFQIDPQRVAIYSVDVSGHGVASAMMTARLAGYLSAASADQNLAFRLLPDGRRDVLSPAELMGAFNRLMLEELQVEQYFTMAYADVDLATGQVRLAQAGHPHPMILRAGGATERVGQGGLPIGLIPGASYEDTQFRSARRPAIPDVGRRDRMSGQNGFDLGEDGLARLLSRLTDIAQPRPDGGAGLGSGSSCRNRTLSRRRVRPDPRLPSLTTALQHPGQHRPVARIPQQVQRLCAAIQTALCPASVGGPSARTGRAR